MLYFLELEIQEIHFQNTIHFIILVSTKKSTWWKLESPAGDILIGKLEIYISNFLETYSLIFNTSNNMLHTMIAKL